MLKRGFPFKCFYTEIEIPEKVFQYSDTEPCYPFGQCLLEKWGYFASGDETFSWGGDCVTEVYDVDLSADSTIGWANPPTAGA